MEYIDDLSYSNLVNLIQGEEIKGADLLNNIAIEMEEVRKTMKEAEAFLNRIKSREQTILRASKDVATLLKKELPLAVKRQDYIVVVSDINLTIERNII
jgi:hypothetical protein